MRTIASALLTLATLAAPAPPAFGHELDYTPDCTGALDYQACRAQTVHCWRAPAPVPAIVEPGVACELPHGLQTWQSAGRPHVGGTGLEGGYFISAQPAGRATDGRSWDIVYLSWQAPGGRPSASVEVHCFPQGEACYEVSRTGRLPYEW